MTKVTTTPTSMKANSFSKDSNATAATIPSWRSVLSICRVPNRMLNTISTSATYSVVSIQAGCWAEAASRVTSGYWRNRLKLAAMAFNWMEMYGRMPSMTITVTMPASRPLLP